MVDIPKGERVIESKARKITWAQADRWYADDDSKPSHTFLFTLDDKYVLDGNKDANSARWINHSCKPNCESDIVDGRIWIESLRDIKAGEELNYDYNITLETPQEFALWLEQAGLRDAQRRERKLELERRRAGSGRLGKAVPER
jgi:SET domain-containing protein